MFRRINAHLLLIALLAVAGGCGDAEKKVSAGDANAIRREGNRVIVPAGSPLASRLEIEQAQMTTVAHQIAAPASVEADPARFSRWRYQGEMENAQASRTQAELQLRSTQLQVEAEVRDAYSRYQASVQRLQLYRGGMLKDADRVLEARLYAYQHGGATLLEVIDAQKTSAAIYLAYSQALTDHAHALVTVQQAAAIWDVSF